MNLRLPNSLQGRLSLWLGVGVTLFWALGAAITAQNLRHEMNEVFDSALAQTGQRLLPLAVRDILASDSESPIQNITPLRDQDEYFTYIVRDDRGQVRLRSQNADVSIFPPFAGVGLSDAPGYRLYSDAALQGTITITVAEPLAHRRAMAQKALLGLALPLALIVPLSLIGVWLVVRSVMTPFGRFRAGIEARGGGDLTPIPTAGLPAEFQPNARAVNQLLDRLRRTLEAERNFTANSAHELRTPVAAALAQVQRLIIEAPDAATRDRAHQIEQALQRLSRLSGKLMQLARAEGGRLRAAGPVDIAATLRMLMHEMMAGVGGPDRIALSLPDAPVMAGIDPDAFAILARNLIENALKHGAGPVTVALSPAGVLRVTNAGPVVPPEVLDRLSRPFERGQTQADGAGLGLAIAKAIAGGTGGRLELLSPASDRNDGFEARFFIHDAAPDHGNSGAV